MNKRRTDIDSVAGLMILWMVIGHLGQVCGYKWQFPNILYFFMPWFYYKAGMLYKETNLRDYVISRAEKLLLPFIVYAFIGQLVLTTCLLVEGVTELKPYLYSPVRSLVLGGCIGGNTPLWFIPSFMVVQCSASWLMNKRNIPWLWGIFSIVVGYLFFKLNFSFIPTYIESAFGGLFFFCMGNWLKELQYKWWMTTLFTLIVLAIYFFHVSGFDVRGNDVLHGYYFIGALSSLAGCVAINGIINWLQPYFKFSVLQCVGRNAMTIYVVHWIVLLLSVRLVADDCLHVYDTKWLLLIGGLSCITIISLYIHILNHVNKRKNTH